MDCYNLYCTYTSIGTVTLVNSVILHMHSAKTRMENGDHDCKLDARLCVNEESREEDRKKKTARTNQVNTSTAHDVDDPGAQTCN